MLSLTKALNYSSLAKKSLFANNVLAGGLILTYALVYGISSQVVLAGLQLTYFLCSFIFALSVMYIRDPEVQRKKAEKSILFNQIAGTVLVFVYLALFGISGVSLLSGFQLAFFMSSYVFAMSFFYLRSPEKLSHNEVSISETGQVRFKTNLALYTDEIDVFLHEIKEPVSVIMGFTELLLRRQFNEHEKEFMLNNIYENALSISHSTNRLSDTTDKKELEN